MGCGRSKMQLEVLEELRSVPKHKNNIQLDTKAPERDPLLETSARTITCVSREAEQCYYYHPQEAACHNDSNQQSNTDHPIVAATNNESLLPEPTTKNVLQDEPGMVQHNSPTIKKCCGRSCRRQSSDLCCEHALFTYTSPDQYCQMCRERYIKDEQQQQQIQLLQVDKVPTTTAGASGHHDLMICKPCCSSTNSFTRSEEEEASTQPGSEDTTTASHDESQGSTTASRQEDDDSSQQLSFSETGAISQEGCPVCLAPFSYTSGAIYILPCGHAICHCHRHKLTKCPLCRQSIHDDSCAASSSCGRGSNSNSSSINSHGGGWEMMMEDDDHRVDDDDDDDDGECNTQEGRYRVMHRDVVRPQMTTAGGGAAAAAASAGFIPRAAPTYWEREEQLLLLRSSSCTRSSWSEGYNTINHEKSSAGSLFSDVSMGTLDEVEEDDEDERRHSWNGTMSVTVITD